MNSIVPVPVTSNESREARRPDRKAVTLRELDLGSIPYISLPSAPFRWQETHGAGTAVAEPRDWLESHCFIDFKSVSSRLRRARFGLGCDRTA
jgi:hypothetical protein